MAKDFIEKFAAADLSGLRAELMQGGLDSWQSAELIRGFLAAHGYGVSHDAARQSVPRFESLGCSVECMQEELEKIAFVM